ncbi:37845_t:CDS:2, partial [Gigaspora margarita]
MVKEKFSIKLYTEGQHMPTNVSIHHESAVTYLNLSRTIRDQVILSQHTDGCKAKEIKLKLLTPFNGLPKTRHATASSLTINSIKPYKFDDIHNIGEDQLIIENEHLHSMMHSLNKDIDSFILNNNQTNLDDLSNSHISTCDYQNLEIQNANISESRFTQPKLNN